MANISDVRASVRQWANGCPDVTIDKYVVEAVRNFCRESYYYQQGMTINQVSGQASYSLAPSNSDEVVTILAVEQSGSSLKQYMGAELNDSSFSGAGYQFEPPSYLVIAPTPTASVTNGLELRLALQPPEGTTTLPDSIYRNFKEAIAAGALSVILSMQNEVWTNPTLASIKGQQFAHAVHTAKGLRMRGFVNGPIRIRPRQYLI